MLGMAVAQAEAPLRADIGVWSGLAHSNTPMAPALGLTGALRWKGSVSLRFRAGFLPGQKQSGLVPPIRTALESSVHGLADVSVLFEPILVDVVGWNARIHVGVGMGVVRTIDDLESAQRQDDPYALLASRQWHPTASWTTGLSGPITRHLAVSFDVSSVYYIEVFPFRPEVQRPLITSVSFLLRPSRLKRPLHD
ncbi:MAG: hypothetical protein ACJAZO_001340 [Myxococcota bacterium]|jgi:hypothetical protein